MSLSSSWFGPEPRPLDAGWAKEGQRTRTMAGEQASMAFAGMNTPPVLIFLIIAETVHDLPAKGRSLHPQSSRQVSAVEYGPLGPNRGVASAAPGEVEGGTGARLVTPGEHRTCLSPEKKVEDPSMTHPCHKVNGLSTHNRAATLQLHLDKIKEEFILLIPGRASQGGPERADRLRLRATPAARLAVTAAHAWCLSHKQHNKLMHAMHGNGKTPLYSRRRALAAPPTPSLCSSRSQSHYPGYGERALCDVELATDSSRHEDIAAPRGKVGRSLLGILQMIRARSGARPTTAYTTKDNDGWAPLHAEQLGDHAVAPHGTTPADATLPTAPAAAPCMLASQPTTRAAATRPMPAPAASLAPRVLVEAGEATRVDAAPCLDAATTQGTSVTATPCTGAAAKSCTDVAALRRADTPAAPYVGVTATLGRGVATMPCIGDAAKSCTDLAALRRADTPAAPHVGAIATLGRGLATMPRICAIASPRTALETLASEGVTVFASRMSVAATPCEGDAAASCLGAATLPNSDAIAADVPCLDAVASFAPRVLVAASDAPRKDAEPCSDAGTRQGTDAATALRVGFAAASGMAAAPPHIAVPTSEVATVVASSMSAEAALCLDTAAGPCIDATDAPCMSTTNPLCMRAAESAASASGMGATVVSCMDAAATPSMDALAAYAPCLDAVTSPAPWMLVEFNGAPRMDAAPCTDAATMQGAGAATAPCVGVTAAPGMAAATLRMEAATAPCVGAAATPCAGAAVTPCIGAAAKSYLSATDSLCMRATESVASMSGKGAAAASFMGAAAAPSREATTAEAPCLDVVASFTPRVLVGADDAPCMDAAPCLDAATRQDTDTATAPCAGVIATMGVAAAPCVGDAAAPCMGVATAPSPDAIATDAPCPHAVASLAPRVLVAANDAPRKDAEPCTGAGTMRGTDVATATRVGVHAASDTPAEQRVGVATMLDLGAATMPRLGAAATSRTGAANALCMGVTATPQVGAAAALCDMITTHDAVELSEADGIAPARLCEAAWTPTAGVVGHRHDFNVITPPWSAPGHGGTLLDRVPGGGEICTNPASYRDGRFQPGGGGHSTINKGSPSRRQESNEAVTGTEPLRPLGSDRMVRESALSSEPKLDYDYDHNNDDDDGGHHVNVADGAALSHADGADPSRPLSKAGGTGREPDSPLEGDGSPLAGPLAAHSHRDHRSSPPATPSAPCAFLSAACLHKSPYATARLELREGRTVWLKIAHETASSIIDSLLNLGEFAQAARDHAARAGSTTGTETGVIAKVARLQFFLRALGEQLNSSASAAEILTFGQLSQHGVENILSMAETLERCYQGLADADHIHHDTPMGRRRFKSAYLRVMAACATAQARDDGGEATTCTSRVGTCVADAIIKLLVTFGGLEDKAFDHRGNPQPAAPHLVPASKALGVPTPTPGKVWWESGLPPTSHDDPSEDSCDSLPYGDRLRNWLDGCSFESDEERSQCYRTLQGAFNRAGPIWRDEGGLAKLCKRAQIHWVKVGYIKSLAQRGGPFPRQQDLDQDSAFVGRLPPGRMISVSAGWAAQFHPSPSGEHLKRIAAELTHLGCSDEQDGVFLDYMSLPQESELEGIRRTKLQQRQFRLAMQEAPRFFAFFRCEVIIDTVVDKPEGFPSGRETWGQADIRPYGARGWCCAALYVAYLNGRIANLDNPQVRELLQRHGQSPALGSPPTTTEDGAIDLPSRGPQAAFAPLGSGEALPFVEADVCRREQRLPFAQGAMGRLVADSHCFTICLSDLWLMDNGWTAGGGHVSSLNLERAIAHVLGDHYRSVAAFAYRRSEACYEVAILTTSEALRILFFRLLRGDVEGASAELPLRGPCTTGSSGVRVGNAWRSEWERSRGSKYTWVTCRPPLVKLLSQIEAPGSPSDPTDSSDSAASLSDPDSQGGDRLHHVPCHCSNDLTALEGLGLQRSDTEREPGTWAGEPAQRPHTATSIAEAGVEPSPPGEGPPTLGTQPAWAAAVEAAEPMEATTRLTPALRQLTSAEAPVSDAQRGPTAMVTAAAAPAAEALSEVIAIGVEGAGLPTANTSYGDDMAVATEAGDPAGTTLEAGLAAASLGTTKPGGLDERCHTASLDDAARVEEVDHYLATPAMELRRLAAASCIGVADAPSTDAAVGVAATPGTGAVTASCMDAATTPCVCAATTPCMAAAAAQCIGAVAEPGRDAAALRSTDAPIAPCVDVVATLSRDIPATPPRDVKASGMGAAAVSCVGVAAMSGMGVPADSCMEAATTPCADAAPTPCMAAASTLGMAAAAASGVGVMAMSGMGVAATSCVGVADAPRKDTVVGVAAMSGTGVAAASLMAAATTPSVCTATTPCMAAAAAPGIGAVAEAGMAVAALHSTDASSALRVDVTATLSRGVPAAPPKDVEATLCTDTATVSGLDPADAPGMGATNVAATSGMGIAATSCMGIADAPGTDAVVGVAPMSSMGDAAAPMQFADAATDDIAGAAAMSGMGVVAASCMDAATKPCVDAATTPRMTATTAPGLGAAATPCVGIAAMSGTCVAAESDMGMADAPSTGAIVGVTAMSGPGDAAVSCMDAAPTSCVCAAATPCMAAAAAPSIGAATTPCMGIAASNSTDAGSWGVAGMASEVLRAPPLGATMAGSLIDAEDTVTVDGPQSLGVVVVTPSTTMKPSKPSSSPLSPERGVTGAGSPSLSLMRVKTQDQDDRDLGAPHCPLDRAIHVTPVPRPTVSLQLNGRGVAVGPQRSRDPVLVEMDGGSANAANDHSHPPAQPMTPPPVDFATGPTLINGRGGRLVRRRGGGSRPGAGRSTSTPSPQSRKGFCSECPATCRAGVRRQQLPGPGHSALAPSCAEPHPMRGKALTFDSPSTAATVDNANAASAASSTSPSIFPVHAAILALAERRQWSLDPTASVATVGPAADDAAVMTKSSGEALIHSRKAHAGSETPAKHRHLTAKSFGAEVLGARNHASRRPTMQASANAGRAQPMLRDVAPLVTPEAEGDAALSTTQLDFGRSECSATSSTAGRPGFAPRHPRPAASVTPGGARDLEPQHSPLSMLLATFPTADDTHTGSHRTRGSEPLHETRRILSQDCEFDMSDYGIGRVQQGTAMQLTHELLRHPDLRHYVSPIGERRDCFARPPDFWGQLRICRQFADRLRDIVGDESGLLTMADEELRTAMTVGTIKPYQVEIPPDAMVALGARPEAFGSGSTAALADNGDTGYMLTPRAVALRRVVECYRQPAFVSWLQARPEGGRLPELVHSLRRACAMYGQGWADCTPLPLQEVSLLTGRIAHAMRHLLMLVAIFQQTAGECSDERSTRLLSPAPGAGPSLPPGYHLPGRHIVDMALRTGTAQGDATARDEALVDVLRLPAASEVPSSLPTIRQGTVALWAEKVIGLPLCTEWLRGQPDFPLELHYQHVTQALAELTSVLTDETLHVHQAQAPADGTRGWRTLSKGVDIVLPAPYKDKAKPSHYQDDGPLGVLKAALTALRDTQAEFLALARSGRRQSHDRSAYDGIRLASRDLRLMCGSVGSMIRARQTHTARSLSELARVGQTALASILSIVPWGAACQRFPPGLIPPPRGGWACSSGPSCNAGTTPMANVPMGASPPPCVGRRDSAADTCRPPDAPANGAMGKPLPGTTALKTEDAARPEDGAARRSGLEEGDICWPPASSRAVTTMMQGHPNAGLPDHTSVSAPKAEATLAGRTAAGVVEGVHCPTDSPWDLPSARRLSQLDTHDDERAASLPTTHRQVTQQAGCEKQRWYHTVSTETVDPCSSRSGAERAANPAAARPAEAPAQALESDVTFAARDQDALAQQLSLACDLARAANEREQCNTANAVADLREAHSPPRGPRCTLVRGSAWRTGCRCGTCIGFPSHPDSAFEHEVAWQIWRRHQSAFHTYVESTLAALCSDPEDFVRELHKVEQGARELAQTMLEGHSFRHDFDPSPPPLAQVSSAVSPHAMATIPEARNSQHLPAGQPPSHESYTELPQLQSPLSSSEAYFWQPVDTPLRERRDSIRIDGADGRGAPGRHYSSQRLSAFAKIDALLLENAARRYAEGAKSLRVVHEEDGALTFRNAGESERSFLLRRNYSHPRAAGCELVRGTAWRTGCRCAVCIGFPSRPDPPFEHEVAWQLWRRHQSAFHAYVEDTLVNLCFDSAEFDRELSKVEHGLRETAQLLLRAYGVQYLFDPSPPPLTLTDSLVVKANGRPACPSKPLYDPQNPQPSPAQILRGKILYGSSLSEPSLMVRGPNVPPPLGASRESTRYSPAGKNAGRSATGAQPDPQSAWTAIRHQIGQRVATRQSLEAQPVNAMVSPAIVANPTVAASQSLNVDRVVKEFPHFPCGVSTLRAPGTSETHAGADSSTRVERVGGVVVHIDHWSRAGRGESAARTYGDLAAGNMKPHYPLPRSANCPTTTRPSADRYSTRDTSPLHPSAARVTPSTRTTPLKAGPAKASDSWRAAPSNVLPTRPVALTDAPAWSPASSMPQSKPALHVLAQCLQVAPNSSIPSISTRGDEPTMYALQRSPPPHVHYSKGWAMCVIEELCAALPRYDLLDYMRKRDLKLAACVARPRESLEEELRRVERGDLGADEALEKAKLERLMDVHEIHYVLEHLQVNCVIVDQRMGTYYELRSNASASNGWRWLDCYVVLDRVTPNHVVGLEYVKTGIPSRVVLD